MSVSHIVLKSNLEGNQRVLGIFSFILFYFFSSAFSVMALRNLVVVVVVVTGLL